MKKSLIYILIALMLVMSGCKSNETNSVGDDSESINIENIADTEDVKSNKQNIEKFDFDISLKEIFPLKLGESWRYYGITDYDAKEIIRNIDRSKLDVTDIYIEGLVDDLVGEYSNDNAYIKKYSISDNQIVQKFGSYEYTILKSPININDTWNDIYFDDMYGVFSAKYEIKSITDSTITVEITPSSFIKDAVPSKYKAEIVFELGNGISQFSRTYIWENDEKKEPYTHTIMQYPSDDDENNEFESRYFSENPYIKNIYSKGYFDYVIKEALEKQYIAKNKFSLTDRFIEDRYKEFILGLDVEDIRSISLAKNVLDLYIEKLENKDKIFGIFIDYYMAVIDNNKSILENWFENGELEYISGNSDLKQIFISDELLSSDPILEIKGIIMNKNGIEYYFRNSIPVVKPSGLYLERSLYRFSSIPMQSYLSLLKRDLQRMPYTDESGKILLTLDEISDFIVDFNVISNAAKEGYIHEGANKEAKKFMQLYIKPTNQTYYISMMDFAVYESTMVHYKKTLQRLSKGDEANILSLVIELLENNSDQYSEKLNKFLIEYGVDVTNDNMSSEFIMD